MKRTKRESRKLNNLLIKLDKFERLGHQSRGYQLAIEFIVTEFNIKHDEFPVMKRLIVSPKGDNTIWDNQWYDMYRWMIPSNIPSRDE